MSTVGYVIAAAAGAAVGAGAVVYSSGQSRPVDRHLPAADPPTGLPLGRILPLEGHGEMFFRDSGPPADPSQPTIVLLHGWLVTADLNWFTCYEPLRGVGRVIAPDHRGHGRGARHSRPFRLSDVADDVAALIREEVDGPAIIVGYSMGGPIAQMVWQRHPDVVAGLVLCATAASFRFDPLTEMAWKLMAGYQVGLRLLPRAWVERAIAATDEASTLIERALGRQPALAAQIATARPLLPWAIGEVERGEPEDLAEAGRELSVFDSQGWLAGLDVPSAQIVTSADQIVPLNAQLQLSSLLSAPLVIDIAADHDAPVAARSAFSDALTQAVRHVAAQTAHTRRSA